MDKLELEHMINTICEGYPACIDGCPLRVEIGNSLRHICDARDMVEPPEGDVQYIIDCYNQIESTFIAEEDVLSVFDG